MCRPPVTVSDVYQPITEKVDVVAGRLIFVKSQGLYIYIYPAHIHPLLVACCMLQVVRNKIVVWVWEDRTVWQECRMGTWYTSILVMAVTGTGTGTGTKLGPGLRTLPSRVPYPSYSVPYVFTVICDTNTI